MFNESKRKKTPKTPIVASCKKYPPRVHKGVYPLEELPQLPKVVYIYLSLYIYISLYICIKLVHILLEQ